MKSCETNHTLTQIHKLEIKLRFIINSTKKVK